MRQLGRGRVLADLTEFLELPPAVDAQLRYREHSDRVASDASLRVTSWTNVPTAAISSSAVGRSCVSSRSMSITSFIR